MEMGIQPVPRELPVRPYRAHMLVGVLTFVRAASCIPGVERIALIGSLTTTKSEPKDADLLVTVTDDLGLAPLARLARQLNGHCTQFGKAGDVFLADPRGRYLGRTCPWRHCGPGIRASCDALHCGRRPYLHDDLGTVQLPEVLIADPPIELWPEIVARLPVPGDVESKLLQPLRKEAPAD
jgi:hypothetical protein